jgi:hypothetical protein
MDLTKDQIEGDLAAFRKRQADGPYLDTREVDDLKSLLRISNLLSDAATPRERVKDTLNKAIWSYKPKTEARLFDKAAAPYLLGLATETQHLDYAKRTDFALKHVDTDGPKPQPDSVRTVVQPRLEDDLAKELLQLYTEASQLPQKPDIDGGKPPPSDAAAEDDDAADIQNAADELADEASVGSIAIAIPEPTDPLRPKRRFRRALGWMATVVLSAVAGVAGVVALDEFLKQSSADSKDDGSAT